MPEQTTNNTTPTPTEIMLGMLKVDLGISVTAYDARLAQYLSSAETAIINEGATTLDNTELSDQQLIIMYAAWLWRRRDDMGEMPRMVRYTLNNRILKDKMGVVTDET